MITFVLCWLLAAVLVGLSGLLRNTALPMTLLTVVATLMLVALLMLRRPLRDSALAIGVRRLVAVHFMRFFGLYFVWLGSQGLVASDVVMLAGWGPVIVALGAVLVLIAFQPESPQGLQAVIVWNVVGVLDVILTFAVMAQMSRQDPLVQGGFAALPLSLLPTFILPLMIVSHFLIFVWWFRGKKATKRTKVTKNS